jgi:hypothetical protein
MTPKPPSMTTTFRTLRSAFEVGREARAISRLPRETNPYPQATDLWRAWDHGWLDAYATNVTLDEVAERMMKDAR